jgi:hypothetical protein
MRTLLLMLLWVLAAPVMSAEESGASDIVFPQKLTASQLLVSCASSSMSATGRLRQRYCEGFLSGLEEGVRVHSLIAKQEVAPSLCVPPDVSARQLRAAFVRNSAKMTLSKEKPAAMFAMKVLQSSFPCR